MTQPIPLFRVHMPPREHLMPNLEKVLYSGYIGQGKVVDEFEASLGAYLGTPHVVTVNAGTSAIQLALRLAGVRGKRVVTTPMTCAATVLPVLAEGGIPVWADVEPDTGNIDPWSAEMKITRDTAAILAMDWGGQPCDLDGLMAIGEDHGIPVIVDAAHSLGAEWNGAKVGTQADYTCFSLQAIKHITTGDGGFLTMKSAEDYERAKLLRWFGLDRTASGGDSRVDSDIEEWGYKFHLNNIAATIGLAQMEYLPGIVEAHRANAAFYNDALGFHVYTQATDYRGNGAWWLYTLLFDNGPDRAAFMEYMRGQGIGVSRVHARLDRLSAFRGFYGGDLPGVTAFFESECCIPVHWGLTTEDRQRVADAVMAFCEGAR